MGSVTIEILCIFGAMCVGPNLCQDLISSFVNMKESSRYLEKASSTEERGRRKDKELGSRERHNAGGLYSSVRKQARDVMERRRHRAIETKSTAAQSA